MKTHSMQASPDVAKLTHQKRTDSILTLKAINLLRLMKSASAIRKNKNKNMNSIKHVNIKESCEQSLAFKSPQLNMLFWTFETTLKQKQRKGENSRAMFNRNNIP